MPKRDSRVGIVMFVIGVILAGACNASARIFTLINYDYESVGGTTLPFFSTLMFALNIAIYLFLIIYWALSVHERLLPSKARSYLIWAAGLMAYLILYHAVKYRVFENSELVVMRFMWYSLYVPLAFIPTLFLMMSIRILKGDKKGGFDEKLLLIPAAILSLLVMTNTLHRLAFAPKNGCELSGFPNTYKNGILYYIIYGYIIVTVIIGLIILARVNGKTRKPLKVAVPFLLLLLIPVMIFTNRFLTNLNAPQPFLFSDMTMLYAVAVFETCIRGRLIPYNEDYVGIFGKMTLPAAVTDKAFNRVYETACEVKATEDEMKNALSQPVYSDSNTRLSGKPIKTGCVFWTEDEEELHKSERRLREANDKIANENKLIRAETKLKEEKARVDFHNEAFEKIAEHIRPEQNRAIGLLNGLRADDVLFDKKAARVLAIDSYIKRCINLMLLGEGEEYLRTSELMRAFNESAAYLGNCGVDAVAVNRAGEQIKTETAIAVYDAFEIITQALTGRADEIKVTLYDSRMEIYADCESVPRFDDLPLKLTANKSGDGFLFSVRGEEADEND